MRSLRFFRGVNLALLAVLASLPLGAIGTIEASHPHFIYLESERWVDWGETLCVNTDPNETYLGFQPAHDMIIATLMFENESMDWQGLNGNKIAFEDVWWAECRFLDSATYQSPHVPLAHQQA